jgi:hypothetical protein
VEDAVVAQPLPPEIHVRRVADGVAYDLPRRPLGGMKLLAAFLVGFGTLCALGPVAFAIIGLAGAPTRSGFDIFALVVTLPFFVAGAAVAAVGLAMVWGRAGVVLRPDRLVAVERLGPVRWRRRRPVAGLRRLEVHRGAAKANGRPVAEGPMAELAAMRAEFESGRPMLIAVGYPERWLLPLAEQLKHDLPTLCPATLFEDDESVTVEVVAVAPDAPSRDRAERPADTAVAVDENPDGITITIPPAGLRKGSKGLFAFSVAWCVLMAVFTAAVIRGPLLQGGWGSAWPFLAFCAAFWAVGGAMMVGAVNMGRRHAIIDVVDDVLLINRRNLFGLKSHKWARAELESVTVGPSGMEVNDIPVLELKVRPVTGKAVGLFAGRDDRELRWLASLIARRLWPGPDEAAA